MNRNTILKMLGLLVIVLMTVGAVATAQVTWYVNNSAIGNDGRNGLSPTIPSPDDGVTGPKKTLGGAQGAIAESNAGDIIVVANTGIAYGTGTGEPATITVNKRLTLRSTGGTPNISSLVNINNTSAAPNNVVVFDSGPFLLSGGLTLTAGVVTNTSQLLTVGGTITRTAAAAVVNGQLLYSGTVNFSYGGATMTTADEFPASGSFASLTTTAGTLTLKTTTATMSGILNTAGPLNLGGNALTISGANAHTIGGNVTNGSLSFTLTGAASVTGNFNLPAVTATKTTAGLATLTIATNTSVSSITATGNASVTFSGANVTIGTTGSTANNVLLSGAGIVTLPAGITVNGNVVLNSTGLTAAATGQINFGGAATINGSVRNEATFTVANDNALTAGTTGLVTFADAAVTITGDVVNNIVVGGTIGTSTDAQNVGQIRFANTTSNVTIQGAIRNGSSTSISTATNPVAFTGLGNTVMTAITTADVRVDGGIVNSSNWSTVTGANNTNNGRVLIGAAATRTTGSQVGFTATRVGAIISTSLGRAWNDGNGDIIIAGDGASDGFFGTSVTASGSAVGGKIVFADENFNINGGITLNRNYGTTPHNIIDVGTATTAHTVTIGGGVSNASNHNIRFVFTQTGNVGITGTVSSTVSGGTTSWPNITTGTLSFGGLTVSAGTVSVPATHAAGLTINGPVSISGGTASLLASGAQTITISGSSSFTGGTVTTTGRTAINFTTASITYGSSTTNTTFSTATTKHVIANPTPTQTVSVTLGPIGPSIPGELEVNNTGGLATAVIFSGGSLKMGALTFTAGFVELAGAATLIATGTFTNTPGYSTPSIGRVTLEGTAAQTFSGAGDFANIEFKNGPFGITATSNVKLTGAIYLTAGAVANGGNTITIENTTTPPTIVRNAGTFAQAPTFNSNVNVTYIGGDKASGFEVPTTPTQLQNLTVATTTGNVAGRGVVTIGVATTVNGTINVYPNQTLLIDAVTLTMNGASIVLDGDIANEGAGVLSLARTTGTTITGSGYLPPVSVAVNSEGNVINGARALVHQLVGTDNQRGGGDDFDPAVSAANGDLNLPNGTGSITVTFGAGVLNSTHLQHINTNHTGNTLTLGATLNASGNLTHVAGSISVGSFVLNLRGTTHAITGGATITGTGTLRFTTTAASTLTINTSAATIGASVDVVGTAGALTLAATGQDLTVAGSLSISGTANGLDIGAGRTLTVTGASVSLASGTAITATSGGTTGILRLNAATPPLTLSGTGAVTIANLTVANDVTLSLSGATPSMTVSTAFVHSGGVLNFGAFDLTITGTFTRTAGTYAATTGYLVINNTSFSRGTSDFTVPNLRFTANAVFAGTALTTVTGNLSLRQAGNVNHTVGGTVRLTVADGATVWYRSGGFWDGAVATPPTYAGRITLIVDQAADGTMIPASVWPSSPATLVSTLRVSNAASTDDIELPGSRTVNTALQLFTGRIDLSHATTGRTLTVADSATITRRNTSSIVGVTGVAGANATSGSVAFGGSAINVVYQPNLAFTSGAELPSSINNMTVTRSANVVNDVVTIDRPVTINGTLTVRNNFGSTAAGTVTMLGNVVVETETATYSLATAPVFTMLAPITFAGSANQTITVPSTGASIGSITINKASNSNTVTIAGGDLTCTGTVNFVRGLILTGTNVLVMTVTQAVPPALQPQGFDRSGVVAGNISHVVGFVRKSQTLAGSGAYGRNEFPVGTSTQYRPVAITFGTSPGVIITARHVDTRPTGTAGLPITDGVDPGVDIARYPGFYWDIYANTSLGAAQYNLELTAEGFSDFDDVKNVRIIRRMGGPADATNTWTKQGFQYDNYTVGGVPTVTAVNLVGAISAARAIFTYGLKSNMVVANPFTIPTLTDAAPTFRRFLRGTTPLITGNTGALSFTVSIDNPAIATVAISNDTLIVTRKVTGSTTVRVTATDAFDGSRITYPVSVNVISNVETIAGAVPTEFALEQNFPNPFNPSTTIRFALPKEAPVTLVIYNMLGVPVRTLINGEQLGAANHQITWDGKDDAGMSVPSGMYLYRISAGSFQATRKMTLLK